jgi:hypothetical protein
MVHCYVIVFLVTATTSVGIILPKNVRHYIIQVPPGVSKQLLRSMLTPLDRVEVDTLLHEFP